MATLDHALRLHPGAWTGTDFVLPHKDMRAPRWAGTMYNHYTSDQTDLQAPGIRDGLSFPSRFTPVGAAYRTNLYDAGRVNNAPMPLKEEFVPYFTSEIAQRRGAYWWDLLHNNLNLLPQWKEQGTFNVPPVARTPIRFLGPYSTLAINQ